MLQLPAVRFVCCLSWPERAALHGGEVAEVVAVKYEQALQHARRRDARAIAERAVFERLPPLWRAALRNDRRIDLVAAPIRLRQEQEPNEALSTRDG